MDKSTWCFTCKTCGKVSTVTCHGAFAPMAKHLAPWPILIDNLKHHQGLKLRALRLMAKEGVMFLLVGILCLFRSCIVRPLHDLLELLLD